MTAAVAVRAGTETTHRTPDRHAVAILAVLAIVLGVSFLRIIGDPFGLGHDGKNGQVWTSSARALTEDPIGSKFGAHRDDGETYTNHPPLITVETATVRGVFGDRRWVDRMPAWLGTVAAVALMERVLRREGIGARGRAVGLLVGFGAPMVAAYGAMLDTPVTSLPFAAWCVLVWQRERDGDAARWERPVSCLLAVLAGWQAALLAALTLLPRAGRLRAAAGVAVGVGLLVGWHVWVHGNLTDIIETFGERNGSREWAHPMPPLEAIGHQWGWLMELFSPIPLVIGSVGMVLALRSRKVIAGLLAAVVLIFPAVTSNAMGIHRYWLYWLVLPVSFGAAVLADRPAAQRIVTVAAVAVAVFTVAVPQVVN